MFTTIYYVKYIAFLEGLIMAKNLLLGNGLNIHFGIDDLKQENIYQRFLNVISRSQPLYESLYDIKMDLKELNSKFSHAPNYGIETLAAVLYSYIMENIKCPLNTHEINRLRDSVKASALNAIFYKGNCEIEMAYFNASTVAHMNTYEKIFTLNYFEAWDTNKRCVYLHGKYDIPDITNESKPILLYDVFRHGNINAYDSALQKLQSSNNIIPFNGEEIVFSPLLDKQKVLDDRVIYPGISTFPAYDLYIYDQVNLYTELDNLESLDIFGMSPYGDDCLIEKISQIPNLSIYVYKMDASEVSEWDKKLQRKCCKDSSEFI